MHHGVSDRLAAQCLLLLAAVLLASALLGALSWGRDQAG
jgi:hypothetical protein